MRLSTFSSPSAILSAPDDPSQQREQGLLDGGRCGDRSAFPHLQIRRRFDPGSNSPFPRALPPPPPPPPPPRHRPTPQSSPAPPMAPPAPPLTSHRPSPPPRHAALHAGALLRGPTSPAASAQSHWTRFSRRRRRRRRRRRATAFAQVRRPLSPLLLRRIFAAAQAAPLRLPGFAALGKRPLRRARVGSDDLAASQLPGPGALSRRGCALPALLFFSWF